MGSGYFVVICAADMQMLLMVEQLMGLIEVFVAQDYRADECFSPICVKAAAVSELHNVPSEVNARQMFQGWLNYF